MRAMALLFARRDVLRRGANERARGIQKSANTRNVNRTRTRGPQRNDSDGDNTALPPSLFAVAASLFLLWLFLLLYVMAGASRANEDG